MISALEWRRKLGLRGPSWLLVAALLAACAGEPTAPQHSGSGGSQQPGSGQSQQPRPTHRAAPITILAAGDIASCTSSGDEATAKILASYPSALILALGDLAYEGDNPTDIQRCYGPSWGVYKDRTRPVPGNHEYKQSNAVAFFQYFDTLAHGPLGFYSYNSGGWHFIALNSSIPMDSRSPQYAWLEADLAADNSYCQLAYWHHPLFSSGAHGNKRRSRDGWKLLYRHGVDIVLNGHDHDYESFMPQTPDGVSDPNFGIREWVVGTGGVDHYRFNGHHTRNRRTANDKTFGVLRLRLTDSTFQASFLPVAGGTYSDSLSPMYCHGAPASP